ncbi:MAG: hypothetical protein MI863_12255 [Desulfobacterales bacterium]|nr:hypothetical protein [Desulfobacterales bacterium]
MKKLILLLLFIPLFSCTTTASFDRAVDDASVVEPKDVYTRLVPVRKDNPDLIWNRDGTRVLVVMWKSRDSYNRFYKGRTHTDPSQDYVTWVTTAPQVREFGKRFLGSNPGKDLPALELRLKQYLGLKPEWTYDLFIELWVDPEDMFRPCVDPGIDDDRCNIEFSDPVPEVDNISCYPCFYKNLYFQDFRTRPGIPWTGMGYTYDWGNPEHHFGASEFILVPGAAYEIRQVKETLNYFTDRSEP